MKDRSIEDLGKLLKNFSTKLARKVEVRLPEIKEALDPSTPLPKNCPNHAALALLILQDVKEPLSEVVAIVKLIEREIRKPRPARR